MGNASLIYCMHTQRWCLQTKPEPKWKLERVLLPVLHLLVPVFRWWQLLNETAVWGIARWMVDDGCVSVRNWEINHVVRNLCTHKKNEIETVISFFCLYLWAAAVAAASIANSLMVFSSKYFCSQRVLSASRERMRSSFSRRSSCRLDTLMWAPSFGWGCLCRQRNTNQC